MCACSVYDGSYSSSSSNNPATELLLYIEQNHLYMVVVATCQNPRCLVNMDVLDLLFCIRICWQKSYIYETNFFIQSYICIWCIYVYVVQVCAVAYDKLPSTIYCYVHPLAFFSLSIVICLYSAIYTYMCIVYSEKGKYFLHTCSILCVHMGRHVLISAHYRVVIRM